MIIRGYEVCREPHPGTGKPGWSFVHKDYDGAGPDYNDPRHGWASTLAEVELEIDDIEEEERSYEALYP